MKSFSIFLFLFSFFLILSFCFSQIPFPSESCSSSNCKLPNCYCASTDIPQNIPIEETPQFIFFTLDDSIMLRQYKALENLDFLLQNNSIIDSFGCNPKLTAFVTQKETDFNLINKISNQGEISLHSSTHNTSSQTDYPTWNEELRIIHSSLVQFAKLPFDKIKGSRAPYLQTNDAYFQKIKELNLLYDSSFIYFNETTKRTYWPFTLDYPLPEKDNFCIFGSCPNHSYPGLWEVPLTNFDYSIKGNVMDPNFHTTPINILFDKFKKNFEDTYNSNRAPRGFYLHWRYLSNNGDFDMVNIDKKSFIVNFYHWLVTEHKNIVFASETDVINWIRNPVKYSELKNQWKCANINANEDSKCSHNPCVYNDFQFEICGDVCPNKFPGIYAKWEYPTNETIPVNIDQNHWLGNTKIHLYTSPHLNNSICADGIIISHANDIKAKSFILSLKFPKKMMKIKDPVYSVWGKNYPYAYYLTDENFILKIRGVKADIPKNFGFNMGGFCVYLNNSDNLKEFKQERHFSWGLDFYDSPIECELGQCKMFCGDNQCDNLESNINCPMDCSSFLSKISMGWIIFGISIIIIFLN